MDTADSAELTQARTRVTALARALQAELIETHLSWVLLAGNDAWKIKKPVRLPFVDYAALQTRRHFCEEELRLNRRLAPSLYLDVAPITGTPEAPVLDGAGAAVEYAVQMRRFPQEALFSRQIETATLADADVDRLAALLANFHAHTPQAVPAGLAGATVPTGSTSPTSPTGPTGSTGSTASTGPASPANVASGFASPEHRHAAALAALEGARPVASPAEQAQLQTWLDTEAAALAPLWAQRQQGGLVRECHGDLHLDNIISLDPGVAAFDGIEFDPALRWIDVLDDIAFAVMDFDARGRRDLAFRLLNQWLDHTGDHAALPALRFSVVYRALVRAQVAQLRGAGQDAVARCYLETALAWTQPLQPRLFITHGLPGSGKTFASQRVLEREGAIRLRSDVERKRLFGLAMLENSGAKGMDLYTRDATARTYAQLFQTARLALQAGYPVILDAAFLHSAERHAALALAGELGVAFFIVDCKAPPQVLRERLLARQGDASEANAAVLETLSGTTEPLTGQELAFVLDAAQLP
ncbi:MAG: AAA family ATPase [Pseudomonadota bacterium]|nr:AAA family ATPase [Pseudomonadota bacterium]